MSEMELRQAVAIKLHAMQCGCREYIGVGDEDSQYEEMAGAILPLFGDAWEEGWRIGAQYGYWNERGAGDEVTDLEITANPYRTVTDEVTQ